MRRRTATFGLLTAPLWPALTALAQDTRRLPKVALLSPQGSEPDEPLNTVLTELAELGYADGKNVWLEIRVANHAIERLPVLAAELVATKPDVVWTYSSGSARAVAAATSGIPVVVAPVNEGTMASLVSDFAHPAGNVTGLTLNSRQQHEKCLQLLKEAAPDITRVGVLVNPLNPVWQNYPDILADAGRALGLTLVRMEARGFAEVDKAFAATAAQDIDAVFLLNESTLLGSAPALERILQQTTDLDLPSVCDDGDFAREGGLLGLGPDYSAITRGAALYIHRILDGAKPSDLPVQHPIEFELVVNLKTAEALGLTIPPSILLGADEVIE